MKQLTVRQLLRGDAFAVCIGEKKITLPLSESDANKIADAVNEYESLKAQNARLLEAIKEALPIVKHFIKNHDFTTIEKMETAIAESEK